MSSADPQHPAFSMVAIGSFLPQLFQPGWFAQQGLLAAEAARSATVELISPQLTSFRVDWLRFLATPNYVLASTHLESSISPLKDLAIGILAGAARGSVTAVDIISEAHWPMESEEAWHAVGHRLAPKEPWTGILNNPGMLSIQMQGARADSFNGSIRVTVQPSAKIPHGLFVHVADHVERRGPDEPFDGIEPVTTLWTTSLEGGKKLAQKIAYNT